MTVAAFCEEYRRSEAYYALELMRPAVSFETLTLGADLLLKHLPTGTPIRLPLDLAPDWYPATSPADARVQAVVEQVRSNHVVLAGVAEGDTFRITQYPVTLSLFLAAALNGTILDDDDVR